MKILFLARRKFFAQMPVGSQQPLLAAGEPMIAEEDLNLLPASEQ